MIKLKTEDVNIIKVLVKDTCVFCDSNKIDKSKLDKDFWLYGCENCGTTIEIDRNFIYYFIIGIGNSIYAFLRFDSDDNAVLYFENNLFLINSFETSEDFVLFIRKLRNNCDLF